MGVWVQVPPPVLTEKVLTSNRRESFFVCPASWRPLFCLAAAMSRGAFSHDAERIAQDCRQRPGGRAAAEGYSINADALLIAGAEFAAGIG